MKPSVTLPMSARCLARTAGGFLSSPKRPAAALAGYFGNYISHLSQPVGNPWKRAISIFTGWFWYVRMLVPVIGWYSRRASARGSIHLPARDRFVVRYLGYHGSVAAERATWASTCCDRAGRSAWTTRSGQGPQGVACYAALLPPMISL
jgi:hypothetical protein